MTRQQLLWLFIWIFIFFLMFCLWNKLKNFTPPENSAAQNLQSAQTSGQKEMYFKVLKEDDGVILSGMLPSDKDRVEMIDAYGKVFDTVQADNLIVHQDTKRSPLLNFFENFADNFSQFDSGYIDYHDSTLEIDGVAQNVIVTQTLQEQLETIEGITIDNKLIIKEDNSTKPALTSAINIENAANSVGYLRIKTAAEVQGELDTMLKDQRVQFLYARDILTPDSEVLVNKIITILKENEKVKLEIAGHTDSDGTRKNNLRLSKRRANSIKNYMQAQGIELARLRATGYGESQPLVVNNSLKNKQKNRRVEFKVIGE